MRPKIEHVWVVSSHTLEAKKKLSKVFDENEPLPEHRARRTVREKREANFVSPVGGEGVSMHPFAANR